MKTKNLKLYTMLLVLGTLLVIAGKLADLGDNLTGIFIGGGAGLFGLSVAQIIIIAIAKKNPEFERKTSIEENDERNIAINNKAKAKGFNAMSYILTILMLIFVFINADLLIILLLVFAYLLVYIVCAFYLNKYSKEM